MTSSSIDRLLQTTPFVLAVVIGTALVWPLSAATRQDPQAEAAKAAAFQKEIDKGPQNFDPTKSYDALIDAKMSVNEANAAVDELRARYLNWKRAHEKDDPNVEHGDWDLGEVFMGESYPLEMPMVNGCETAQKVELTYPRAFKLTGDKDVSVPPSKPNPVDPIFTVKMELDMTKPSPPQPPFPRPVQFMCTPLEDILLVVKHEVVDPPKEVEGGIEIHKCLGEVKAYRVTLHVHVHPPLPPADPEGGGKKKKPHPACKNYWDHGDWFPTIEYADPTRCRDEIRDLATPWFGELVEEEKVDPWKYEWLPKKEDIQRLNEKELLELKERAVRQLQMERLIKK